MSALGEQLKWRLEPLGSRDRKELEGYVSLSTQLSRAALFLIAVGVVGMFAWRAVADIEALNQLRYSWAIWLAATSVFAWFLYQRAGAWTGGRQFREAVRRDLDAGCVAVAIVRVFDAVKVEEREDEGPAFFLNTEAGVILFAGQQMCSPVRRGFPWTEFEIWETAESRSFLRLRKTGEKLTPSMVREPFSHEELNEFCGSVKNYGLVSRTFDELLELFERKRIG